MSAFQELSLSDLRALGEAIESGRLAAPFTITSVRRYCSQAHCDAVSKELQQLARTGATMASLMLLLKILVAERAHRPTAEDLVDLVCTGPEVPGTAHRDTGVVVRELFAGANDSVLVAGYAVYQGRKILLALADRMVENPELKVTLFLDIHRAHGDTTESSQLVQQFAHRFRTSEWPGQKMPKVYYDPRALEIDAAKKASLHAKCIVVDKTRAFVSSANFTEAAQARNIEVGVLIRSERLSKELANHFESLAATGFLRLVPGV